MEKISRLLNYIFYLVRPYIIFYIYIPRAMWSIIAKIKENWSYLVQCPVVHIFSLTKTICWWVERQFLKPENQQLTKKVLYKTINTLHSQRSPYFHLPCLSSSKILSSHRKKSHPVLPKFFYSIKCFWSLKTIFP